MTESILTARLTLTPFEVADAAEMVDVLSDPDLYAFTGGIPPTLAELDDRYRYQSAGAPSNDEIWHNWILRLDGKAIGHVQATVRGDQADLAWVVGIPQQGFGYATEASSAMKDWLSNRGTANFSAHIHPDHSASNRIARKLGLQPTGQLDDDGEMIWK